MIIKNIQFLKNNLLKNFLALGLVQATNLLIPLITFPYLIRVVGLEKFGVISYGLTILAYLITIADYGFNLSATRLVALNRNNTTELSRLFTNVMATKLVLFIFSILIMVVLCITVTRIQQESTAYMLGMFYVLGSVLMPVWFFQGLEEMKYITYANVIAKVIQLSLLLLFVSYKEDYVFVLGLYGVANITSGLYSIRRAVIQHGLHLKIPNLTQILEQLRDSWYFFSSNFSITIANGATIVILGFFVSNTEISYYSIAEKVAYIAWMILNLFSQAIFPTVCKLAKSSSHELYKFLKKVTLPLIALTGFMCLVGYIFSEEIIHLIIGYYDDKTAYLLRITIVVPFVVALNIPANQILLAYDYKKDYAALFNGSALANVILCTVLVYIWGVIGAAVCIVIIQSFITISLYVLLTIKLKKPFKLSDLKINQDT